MSQGKTSLVDVVVDGEGYDDGSDVSDDNDENDKNSHAADKLCRSS